MKIILKQKPKRPIVVSGFPGLGMVGAIAAEFLIQHLATKKIGKVMLEDTPALVAIHDGKLIEPFGIFYNAKYNIVVVHSIVVAPGTEWKLADALIEVCRQLKAKELISLEGVGSPQDEQAGQEEQAAPAQETSTFFYTTNLAKEKALTKSKLNAQLKRLNEGIIVGVTSALLIKADAVPVTCFFAETHTNLPDSHAAAELIKALDVYLGLDVDYKPLLKLAVQFEDKLRTILTKSKQTEQLRDKKVMSYVG